MAVRREKEEELKGMATLFEMKSTIIFVMFSLTRSLPGRLTKSMAKGLAETWIGKQKIKLSD